MLFVSQLGLYLDSIPAPCSRAVFHLVTRVHRTGPRFCRFRMDSTLSVVVHEKRESIQCWTLQDTIQNLSAAVRTEEGATSTLCRSDFLLDHLNAYLRGYCVRGIYTQSKHAKGCSLSPRLTPPNPQSLRATVVTIQRGQMPEHHSRPVQTPRVLLALAQKRTTTIIGAH